MLILALIISSLALLAATTSLLLIIMDKKRSKKRNTALTQYTDTIVKNVKQEMNERINALESGIVPDFEKAKEAANAVNDFNAGITGILGYDPYSALQAQRENNRGGEAR